MSMQSAGSEMAIWKQTSPACVIKSLIISIITALRFSPISKVDCKLVASLSAKSSLRHVSSIAGQLDWYCFFNTDSKAESIGF